MLHQQTKAIADSPVDQVLAGPLLFKVKAKFPFTKSKVINRSARVIIDHELVKLVPSLYSR